MRTRSRSLAVIVYARRHVPEMDAVLLLPHIGGLASHNADQAVLLLARLRMQRIPVPRDAYMAALKGMAQGGTLQSASPKAASVVKMLTADHGAVGPEQLASELVDSCTSMSELQAVHDWAVAGKVADVGTCAAAVAAYLRCTAGQPPSSQRLAAWWILKTIRTHAAAGKLVPAALHLQLLRRLIGLKFRAAAEIQFENLRGHPDYETVVSTALLQDLVVLCGVRSARDGMDYGSIAVERRLTKAGLGANVRHFLTAVWGQLEHLHNLQFRQHARQDQEGETQLSTFPTLDAHVALLTTCSLQGDLPALQHAHQLIRQRYPAAEFRVDVQRLLVAGASRAGDPLATLEYVRHVAAPDVQTCTCLLHSVRSLASYHHLDALLQHIARAHPPGLDLPRELQAACFNIAQSEVVGGKGVVLVPVPSSAPRRNAGSTASSALLQPLSVLVGMRKSVTAHYFLVHVHRDGSVQLHGRAHTFTELQAAIEAFEQAPAGPTTCGSFGCIAHGAPAAPEPSLD